MQKILERYREECFRYGIAVPLGDASGIGSQELADIAKAGCDVTYVLTGVRKQGLADSERKIIEEYRAMNRRQQQVIKSTCAEAA